MFALATAAQLSHSPVQIYISDSSTLSAFPGRCSVIALNLSQ